jgi:hypothetical protein
MIQSIANPSKYQRFMRGSVSWCAIEQSGKMTTRLTIIKTKQNKTKPSKFWSFSSLFFTMLCKSDEIMKSQLRLSQWFRGNGIFTRDLCSPSKFYHQFQQISIHNFQGHQLQFGGDPSVPWFRLQQFQGFDVKTVELKFLICLCRTVIIQTTKSSHSRYGV